MSQISLFSGYDFRTGSYAALSAELEKLKSEDFWDSGSVRMTANMYFDPSLNQKVFNEIKATPWNAGLSHEASVALSAWIESKTNAIYHCQIPVEETDFLPEFIVEYLETAGSALQWKVQQAFGSGPFCSFKMRLKPVSGPIKPANINELKWPTLTEVSQFASILKHQQKAPTEELLDVVCDDIKSIFGSFRRGLEADDANSQDRREREDLFLLPLWVRVKGVTLDDLKKRNLRALAGLTPRDET